jgi:hypothetical protein
VSRISLSAKISSWLAPADKAFYLSTTTKNLGYHSKTSYGLRMSNKKRIRYSINLSYMSYPNPATVLPGELVEFLRSGFGLSGYSIKHFGICLEMGYTVEQIRQTFRFDPGYLTFRDDYFDWKPDMMLKYLVFCMEAGARSKKSNADRRWEPGYFLDIAETAYRKHGVHAVFIGVTNFPELPDKPYFFDFRQKLNLKRTAMLLHNSEGYVGNDTGPLHGLPKAIRLRRTNF